MGLVRLNVNELIKNTIETCIREGQEDHHIILFVVFDAKTIALDAANGKHTASISLIAFWKWEASLPYHQELLVALWSIVIECL